MEGNVAPHIGHVFVTTADPLHGADNLKPDAIEQNGGANRGPPGKEIPGEFVAQDDHITLLTIVQVIEPASLLERKIPNPIVLRLHAGNLPVGTGKFANRTYVITVNNRRSVADVGSFSADVSIVLVVKQISASGVHVACDHRGATGEDKHDVFAEFSQVALVSRTKTFA